MLTAALNFDIILNRLICTIKNIYPQKIIIIQKLRKLKTNTEKNIKIVIYHWK